MRLFWFSRDGLKTLRTVTRIHAYGLATRLVDVGSAVSYRLTMCYAYKIIRN